MRAVQGPQPAALVHAGPPPDTDTSYCPDDRDTCYFMSAATAAWGTSNTRCSQAGGYMVSWSDYEEQMQVGRCRAAMAVQLGQLQPAAS